MPQQPKSVTTLKLQKGKLYGDQAAREEIEPLPQKPLKPKCPSRFSPAEKKEWRYYKRILENYGLFTIANAPILELLSTNTIHYASAMVRGNETLNKQLKILDSRLTDLSH